MKRIIFLLLVIIFVFCGCSGSILEASNDTTITLYDDPAIDDEDSWTTSSTTNETILKSDNYSSQQSDENFTASWLTYLELFNCDDVTDENRYKLYISEIMDNMLEVGLNNLFVQVRPFCDSIYPSDYFPTSSIITGNQGYELAFDYLQAIIDVANEKGISIHAWINPYRVLSNSNNVDELSEDNIVLQWIEEENGNVIVLESSIYLNPASTEVQELVLNGIRELLENYDLAGIHLDDYFYPTTDESFDEQQYSEYTQNGGTLSLSDFRRENINNLMSSLYRTVKSYSSDLILSVSPSGDIEKNYDEHYCDVRLWLSTTGYADMIIPQIYYGFDHDKFAFDECLSDWLDFENIYYVDLVIGLALYKCGNEDAYAGEEGLTEWIDNDDIISRQVTLVLSEGCDGFALFSSTSIDLENENVKNELINLNENLS